MNAHTASSIQIRQIRAFDQAGRSQHMAEEIISLAQKLDECVSRMGCSSVHTLQMAVQLLTKGKVRLQYRASHERLQLLKSSARLARPDAIAIVENYLAAKPQRHPVDPFNEPTAAIILEAESALPV
jgi:hypothetical protein